MKDNRLSLYVQGFVLSFLVWFSSLNYAQKDLATASRPTDAQTKCWQAQLCSYKLFKLRPFCMKKNGYRLPSLSVILETLRYF